MKHRIPTILLICLGFSVLCYSQWTSEVNVVGAAPSSRRVNTASVQIWPDSTVIVHGGEDKYFPGLWYDDTYSLKAVSDNTTKQLNWTYMDSNYKYRPPLQGPGSSLVWSNLYKSAFLYGGWSKQSGAGSNILTDNVYQLDWLTQEWSQLSIAAGGPTPRYAHAAFYDEHTFSMYVFGGTNGTHNFNDLWQLDLSNISAPSWLSLEYASSQVPPARHGHAGNIYNDFLYILGGTNTTSGTANAEDFFNDLWEFNITSMTWTKLTPAYDANFNGSFTPRHSFTSFKKDNNGIWMIFGGQTHSSQPLSCDTCVDILDLGKVPPKFSTEVIGGTGSGPAPYPPPVALREPLGLWLYGTDGVFLYSVANEICGNNVTVIYEDCDDGNDEDLDGCNKCIYEFCGDGIINNNGTEDCDGGTDCPFDCICNATIHFADGEGGCIPWCGNAEYDDGKEECEGGPMCAVDGTCACPPPLFGDGKGGCKIAFSSSAALVGYLVSLAVFVVFLIVLGLFLWKCVTKEAKFRLW